MSRAVWAGVVVSLPAQGAWASIIAVKQAQTGHARTSAIFALLLKGLREDTVAVEPGGAACDDLFNRRDGRRQLAPLQPGEVALPPRWGLRHPRCSHEVDLRLTKATGVAAAAGMGDSCSQ